MKFMLMVYLLFCRHNLRTNIKHKFIKREPTNPTNSKKVNDSSNLSVADKLPAASADKNLSDGNIENALTAPDSNSAAVLPPSADLGHIDSIDEGTKLFQVDVEENIGELRNNNVSYNQRQRYFLFCLRLFSSFCHLKIKFVRVER